MLFLLDWRPVFWSTREEFFCELSNRLVHQGITPVLFISEEVEPRVRERFTAAGAHLTPCSYHAQPFEYWGRIRAITREFTVLFAHARFFDYFTLLFWMCRLSGIRTVMFTEANSGEWKGRGWKAALIKLRAAVLCAPVDQFIAISEFIRARLEAVGIPSGKIAVVYNGVDLCSFQKDPAARMELRRELGVGQNTVVLIFMSALLAWKRPEIALRVCAELARRGVDVVLWMAGKGPLQTDLELEAKRLGIEGRVRWLGHQPDPHRWLASADLFLHTSEGEAFGNVLVEALGCGLPIAASKSGATPELIEQGKTGMLVPLGPQEMEQLADAVQQMTSSSERYKSLSSAAEKSAARFSTGTAVDRTMEVYAPWLR